MEGLAETPTKTPTLLFTSTAAEVIETARRRKISGCWASSRGPILGRIHAQAATIELEVIEFGDRILSFVIRGKLDEGETARAARLPIGTDVNADDLSDGGERLAQPVLGRVEAQVSDEYFLWNGPFLPIDDRPSWLVGP